MLPTIACHLCALVGARNGAKPSTDRPEAARRKGPEKGPRPNNLNVSLIEIGGSMWRADRAARPPMTCRYGTCARVKWAVPGLYSVRGTRFPRMCSLRLRVASRRVTCLPGAGMGLSNRNPRLPARVGAGVVGRGRNPRCAGGGLNPEPQLDFYAREPRRYRGTPRAVLGPLGSL